MSAYAIVMTTVGDESAADALAERLVEGKFAACVQILPIRSVYRWQGTIERAAEHMLVCKIRAADFDDVAAAIKANHAYDVPEIVLLPIEKGFGPYLDWIANATER